MHSVSLLVIADWKRSLRDVVQATPLYESAFFVTIVFWQPRVIPIAAEESVIPRIYGVEASD